jgi:hypothetical protein
MPREQLVSLGLYFNNTDWWTKVAFSPQHAMACWLGSALLYDMFWVNRNPRGAIFVWAMTLLWSPFTPLGLLLLPLLALPRLGIKSYLEITNLLGGGVLILVMGIYYKAHLIIGNQSWLWSHGENIHWLAPYLLFICTQVMPGALCIFLIDRKYDILQNLKPLFFGATALLILVPLYKIGDYSDLRAQASGPFLLFLSLSAAACFTSEHFNLRKPLFFTFVVVYLAGAVYPLCRPWYCIATKNNNYSIQNIRQTMGMADISQLHSGVYNTSVQYMGKTDSLAYKYLLKH